MQNAQTEQYGYNAKGKADITKYNKWDKNVSAWAKEWQKSTGQIRCEEGRVGR